MSDEDLRALERAAASDDGARLRFARALLRAWDSAQIARFAEDAAEPAVLAALIRVTPTTAMDVRVVLVRALRRKDKEAAKALAAQLPAEDPLRGVLGADGEVVI